MKNRLSSLWHRIRLVHVLGAAGLFIVLNLFLFIGPPDLLTVTSAPEFCAGCHVMEDQYESWHNTGLHRSIKCVDCHLPNDNPVNHFVWKGIDGMKDVVYFYGRLYGDEIHASSRAVGVIKANCIQCHGEMVSRMETSESSCWSCHRRVNHGTVISMAQ